MQSHLSLRYLILKCLQICISFCRLLTYFEMNTNILVLVEKKKTSCYHNRPLSEIQNFVYTSSEDPAEPSLYIKV